LSVNWAREIFKWKFRANLLSSGGHSRLADATKQTSFHWYVTYRAGPSDSCVGPSPAEQ